MTHDMRWVSLEEAKQLGIRYPNDCGSCERFVVTAEAIGDNAKVLWCEDHDLHGVADAKADLWNCKVEMIPGRLSEVRHL